MFPRVEVLFRLLKRKGGTKKKKKQQQQQQQQKKKKKKGKGQRRKRQQSQQLSGDEEKPKIDGGATAALTAVGGSIEESHRKCTLPATMTMFQAIYQLRSEENGAGFDGSGGDDDSEDSSDEEDDDDGMHGGWSRVERKIPWRGSRRSRWQGSGHSDGHGAGDVALDLQVLVMVWRQRWTRMTSAGHGRAACGRCTSTSGAGATDNSRAVVAAEMGNVLLMVTQTGMHPPPSFGSLSRSVTDRPR